MLIKMEKNKKQIMKILLAIIFVAMVTLFAKYDYFLYDSSIGKITKVVNTMTEDSTREEPRYEQSLSIKILNGEFKGQTVHTTNRYYYSQLDTTRYTKGNDVFITVKDSEGQLTASISKLKLDYYAAFIVAAFVAVILLLAGRKGILSLLTLAINIGIFLIALENYMLEEHIGLVTAVVTVFFILSTLLVLNGFTRKALGAIVSSLITVGIVYIVYKIVYHHSTLPSFELMEYTNGNEDFEALFLTSVILGCLGAVMDVAITINSSVAEIVNTAIAPTLKSLKGSIKAIGYDIMGTMVNVLFFTYLSGSIPMFLIKVKNDYSLDSILNYDIMFEMLRFLLGSIGIVLAIPVAGVVSVLLYRKNLVKEDLKNADNT